MRLFRTLLLKALRTLARFKSIRDATSLVMRWRGFGIPAIPSEYVAVSRTVPELLDALRRDGYVEGIALTAVAREELAAFCQVAQFKGNAGAVLATPAEFSKHPESFLFRRMDPHADSPVVQSIARDARLVELAAAYLGAQPVLHSTQLWYSLPLPPGRAASTNPEYGFHYDIDDFKFLKVFFYLSDVDETAGPHVALTGSHADFSLRKKFRRRLSESEARCLPAKVFTGAAGSGFVEDTNIYHKGTAPLRPRLVLQVEYSLTGIFRDLEGRARPDVANGLRGAALGV